MILTYVCEEALDGVERNPNIQRKLKEIQEKATEEEADQLTEEIKGSELRQDTVDNVWRLLIEKRRFEFEEYGGEKVIVYCLRKVFHRDKLDIPQRRKDFFEEWTRQNPLTDKEISKIRNYALEEVIKVYQSKKRAPLPPEYRSWCEGISVNINELIVEKWIYESDLWVQITKKTEIKRMWRVYHKLLNKICNKTAENAREFYKGVKLIEDEGAFVLYKDYSEKGIIFVFKQGLNKATESDKRELDRFKFLEETNVSKEILTRYAAKAYPDIILSSYDDWCDIEEDAEANLALSPEEEGILTNIKLPSFINGRAGSGKSTILYYLFSEICYKKLQNNLEGEPLFITYSRPLVRTAKNLVIKILENFHRYKGFRFDKKTIENYFISFHDFILRKLIPEDRHSRFLDTKYISFNNFKDLYINAPLSVHNSISPEIAWYVIRTFIKGYNKHKPLTPEEYEHLPRRDKTIISDYYEEIYNKVWPWYRNLLEREEYWDDQDLVLEALKNKNFSKLNYTAIFCDESQDFTRIELELLLNSSIYSRYDLEGLKKIPFVFAGDPLQSINPSGFRWEALKSNFYTTFSQELGLKNLKLTDCNLQQNYRSVKSIVRLCNLIQYFRSKFLYETNISPQDIWLPFEGNIPTYYELSQNIVQELKKIDIGKNIIIIPEETGNEKRFLEQDELLSSLLPKSEYREKNLFTSGVAKGLEFKKVILYKWGEYGKELFQLLERGSKIDESELLKASYFFNKLYVAASRAKENLFILDTSEGIEKFWKHFTEEYWSQIEIDEKWKNSIGHIHRGYAIKEIEEDDPISIAIELSSKGRERGDYELLERAAIKYKQIGEEAEALKCEAEAAELRKKYDIAGEKYAQLGNIEKARECFWKGCLWSKLIEVPSAGHSNLLDSLQRKVAHYMIASIDDLSALNEILLDDYFLEKVNKMERPWSEVVDRIKSQLEILTSHTYDESNILTIANQVEKIAEEGFNQLYKELGRLFYQIKRYKKACDCWEKCASTDTMEYYDAKGEIESDINRKIQLFHKGGLYDKIIDTINGLSNVHILTDEAKDIIYRCYEKKQDYEGLFNFAQQVKNVEKMLDLIAKGKVFDTNKIRSGLVAINDKINILTIWETLKVIALDNRTIISDILNKLLSIEAYIEYIDLLRELYNKKIFSLDEKLEWGSKFINNLIFPEITPDKFKEENENDKISDFIFKDILNWFYKKSFTGEERWLKYIKPINVSIALERIGTLYKDLLPFYEKIIDYYEGKDKEVQNWFKRRYLKIMLKYADYLEKKKDNASEYRIKANELMQKWNISLAGEPDLPLYPVLIKKQSPEIKDTLDVRNYSIQFTCADITVKVFYNEGRIILRNNSSEKGLRIYIDKFSIVPDDINDLNIKEIDSQTKHFSSQSLQVEGFLKNRNIKLVLYKSQEIELELHTFKS